LHFIPLSRTSDKNGGMETTNTDNATGTNSPEDFGYSATDQRVANQFDSEQPIVGVLGQYPILDALPGQGTEQIVEGSELATAATTTEWNPVVSQSPSLTSVPAATPVPPMTPWTAATPVPPTAIQWPAQATQATQTTQATQATQATRETQAGSQGSSYPQSTGASTSSATSTLHTPTGPAQPNDSQQPVGKKQGWIKPALIGGLVGALTSGAILGGVLASTRTSNNESGQQITQASSNTKTPAAANAPQAGGSKVVPALASSSGQADVPSIVRELSKSIVTINTKGFPSADLFGSSQVPEGAGTGIVLSKDGFVLTNAHVIADAQTIKVTIPGGKTCQADVVGRDRTNDVAVVRCRNVTDFVPAALGKSGEMKVGESVVAIGNALGLEGNPTVTTGILSATNRALEGDGERLTGLLQTDAAINPGNSGGPLVNARGQVVGMNTAIYQNTNNIGFAIPIDSILPIVEKIRSGEIGKPKTFLGVTTQTMDSIIQKQYSLGTDKGAIVVEVTIGSPAQNAGLQRGDIITKFDGVSLTDNKQLGERVRKHKAGDVVDMTYLRGTQSIDTKVTLGSALV
jgi:S1-C subfamily serine protease